MEKIKCPFLPISEATLSIRNYLVPVMVINSSSKDMKVKDMQDILDVS